MASSFRLVFGARDSLKLVNEVRGRKIRRSRRITLNYETRNIIGEIDRSLETLLASKFLFKIEV